MTEKIKIRKNISLAPFTTFKIGGKAKYFTEIKNEEEIREVIKWAKEKKERINILAGGSNVLISDKGIAGLVIKFSNKRIIFRTTQIEVDAGVSLTKLSNLVNQKSLSGLEWAAGIPGTIGGAVRGNAGAFGKAISQVVKKVMVYDMIKDVFICLNNPQCNFNYRNSIFKEKDNLFIIKVILKLKKSSKMKVNDLTRKYLNYRLHFQPKGKSAGSIFKNLKIDDLRRQSIKLANLAEKERQVKGGKVPVGWLIEKLGLKGKSIGQAKISQKHANFIINTGQTKAKDVIKLINLIKKQALNKYKIALTEEIQYLGF